MTDSTSLRRLANRLADSEVKTALLQAAYKIEELIVQNHILTSVAAIPQTDQPNPVDQLAIRVAQIERQLPNFAMLELTIEDILKRFGYTPR